MPPQRSWLPWRRTRARDSQGRAVAVTTEEAAALQPPAQGPRLTLTLEEGSGISLDVAPLPIGLAMEDDAVEVLIPAGTPLPAEAVTEVTTSANLQRALRLQIVEGARPRAADNRPLGTLMLLDLPLAPAGVPKVRLALTLTRDYQLLVAASDLLRHRPVQLQLRRPLSDASVAPPPGESPPSADATAVAWQQLAARVRVLRGQVSDNEAQLRSVHGAGPLLQLHDHLTRASQALGAARRLPAELERAAEELERAEGLAAQLAEEALRHPLASTLDARARARPLEGHPASDRSKSD